MISQQKQLNVLNLGPFGFAELLTLQQKVIEARQQKRIADTVLLCEPSPVITLGRDAHRSNLLVDEEFLAQRGVDLLEVKRGGDVTYHGPGQVLVFSTMNLRELHNGPEQRISSGSIRNYAHLLEEVLIRTCGDFGVPAQRVEGRIGTWTVAQRGVPEKKIASIGFHISHGVTSQGCVLNVMPDLSHYNWIVACGIADRGATSLEVEVNPAAGGPALTMQNAIQSMVRNFGEVFERQIHWMDRATLEQSL